SFLSEHLKNVHFDPSHSKILLTCGVGDDRERFKQKTAKRCKDSSCVVITFNCRFGELQSYTQLAPILETNFRSDRFIYIRFLVSF
ncbi:hypothetical protein, partial [Leptospira interrogans]